jgi:SAM-dependent methyltransferase
LSRQEISRYSAVNAIKANFGDIYTQKDPRDYFRALGNLDYMIPEVASPVFLQLASRLNASKGRPSTILDVGCSYGLLSAIMRHGLTMDQLRDRYASPPMRRLSSKRLTSHDAYYFASWPEQADMSFIGLDASPGAIAYAQAAGLLENGLAIDLETSPLTEEALASVARADLIVSTGAIGYVTEKTFTKLLTAFEPGNEPWVASFVLRVFDYEPISRCLARRGLITERFEGATFVQRRATGRLTDADYKNVLMPKLETMFAEFGRLRVLLYMDEGFSGWDLGAAWDDATLGLKHRADFEKIAVVGGPEWVAWIVKLSAFLIAGEIKLFSKEQLSEAWVWTKAP